MNDLLKLKIEKLPTCPGCYLMKSEGRIIYVGKAVNLKNRVSQYFTHSKAHTVKVRAMVARIDDFDIVLCDTNLEALILECNLIKLHKPQYNILLKDDKHYPYLKIDLAQDYPAWSWCAGWKRTRRSISARIWARRACARCSTCCAGCSPAHVRDGDCRGCISARVCITSSGMSRAVRVADHAGGIRPGGAGGRRFSERQIRCGDRPADRADEQGRAGDAL